MTSQTNPVSSNLSKKSIIAIAAASVGAAIILAIFLLYPQINLSDYDDFQLPDSDVSNEIEHPESGPQSTQLPSIQTGANPVIAEVNGEEISLQELKQAQELFQAQSGQGIESTVLLDQLITKELLLQEAENRDISVTRQEAESSLGQQIMQNQMTVDQFKERLQAQGRTYDDTVDLYLEQITIDELLADEMSSTNFSVSDSEAESFFDENEAAIKSQFGEDVVYNDVTDLIRNTILQQKQQSVVLEFVNQLKSDSEIITYKDRL